MTPDALLAGPCVAVEVTRARGSTPREAGAWMLVGPAAIWGTIGGGQLEFMAIDAAQAMLRDPEPGPLPQAGEGAPITAARPDVEPDAAGADFAPSPALLERAGVRVLDVPLGPEIGQCCGGRVALALTRVDAALAAALRGRLAAEAAARPPVMVYGGGHVGRALCAALAPLPLRVTLVESRAAELDAAPPGVARLLAVMPEAAARAAEPRAAHLILTHDHATDFLIAAEALTRGDSPYVGMIGSATKRARFAAFARARGLDPAPLVCPLGGTTADKRPAVIAALAAAELVRALAPIPALAETR